MRWNLRSPLAALCVLLLLWQAAVAPLVHASAVQAVAHTALSQDVPPTPAAAQADAMPCHGHEPSAAMSTLGTDAHSNAHASVALDGGPSHDSKGPDCCESLDCQCACVHASLASVSVPVSARVVPAHPTEMGGHLPVLRARVVELFKPPI